MQRIRNISAMVLIWAFVGCVSDTVEDTDSLQSSAAETVGNKRERAACGARWNTMSSVPSARNIAYSGAQSQCSGGAQSGAITLGNFIRDNFGTYMDLDVLGRGVQIYNCRTVRGGRSNSVHGDGRAVDIFIPTLPGGVADNAKGDRIANWLVDNAAEIGIQYVIWDQSSFRGNRQPQSQCYTGSHPHNDHIHIELTWAAARSETPFFTATDMRAAAPIPDTQSSQPQESTGAADNPYESSNPSRSHDGHGHQPPSNSETSATTGSSWLGEPCSEDTHCIRTGSVPASCIVPNGARWGFCTVSCDGLCPDRSGHAETFCAAARMIGFSDVGLCMAKSESTNGYCSQYPDFETFTADRFLNQSSYRARTASVCVVAPPRSTASEDQTEADARALCGDPRLIVSDHGRYCEPQDENQWRCACSERYETPVSQVCRSGAWVNYDLNPRDCARCDGDYSGGCDGR